MRVTVSIAQAANQTQFQSFFKHIFQSINQVANQTDSVYGTTLAIRKGDLKLGNITQKSSDTQRRKEGDFSFNRRNGAGVEIKRERMQKLKTPKARECAKIYIENVKIKQIKQARPEAESARAKPTKNIQVLLRY